MNAFRGVWILMLSLALPVSAQQQSAPAPEIPAANSQLSATSDHQISLDVVVTDKSGNPVPGLAEQDFTVLDNKQPRKIVSFQGLQPDTPQAATQVILVIDTVNAGFQSISYEQQQLDRFFKENGGKLAVPTSLVIFTDSGVQMQNAPTQDGTTLATMLDQTGHSLRVINRSQGFYGAADRLGLSLNALGQITSHETQQPGRKLVIWIGPGWPILSGPGIELSNKQQQAIFNSIASLSTALRQARITLYDAMPLGLEEGLGRLLYYESYLNPVSKEGQAQSGNLSLQVLAIQSGGLVLNSSSDLDAQVTSCVKDAHAFYTLSFDTQPADKRNEYHRLEVKTDKPGVSARTRTVYYAQP